MKNEVCKKVLINEYLRRKQKNQAYSLRAFASFLNIGVASISDCIAGKRALSLKNLLKIKEKLSLSPAETELLLSKTKRHNQIDIDWEIIYLKDEEFKIISDWYHYAILELSYIKNHKADPVWIAKFLSISELEAQIALERLVNLNFIKIERDKIKKLTPPISSSKDIPSSAVRKRHKQMLEIASECIENEPIEKRKFFEITMAIDPALIPKAHEMMIKYGRKICKILESKNQKEVYSLSMSLFPLSSKKKSNI